MDAVKEWLFSGFDSPRVIVAQIIGIIPIIISIFIYVQNTRKKIVIAKASMDIFMAIHLILLEAYSGAMLNIVVTIRNLLFLKKEKLGKWKNAILCAFAVFIVLCAVPGFLALKPHLPETDSPFEIFEALFAAPDFFGLKPLLPVTGSLFALIGFWQEDVKKLRLFNLAGTTLWLIYGIREVSISTTVVSVFSIISIFAGFIRSAMEKKKQPV